MPSLWDGEGKLSEALGSLAAGRKAGGLHQGETPQLITDKMMERKSGTENSGISAKKEELIRKRKAKELEEYLSTHKKPFSER